MGTEAVTAATGVPYAWVATMVGTLASVITFLFWKLFDSWGARLKDAKEDTKSLIDSLNENTRALDKLSLIVERSLNVGGR
jgi:biopolymer transport protein ExbB/TolQ